MKVALPRSCRVAAAVVAAFLLLSSGSAGAEVELSIHRADRTTHPENTLVAIQHSISLGVDMIDSDIWLSQDGVPMLFHDLDMCRTTNIGDLPDYDCTVSANNPLGRFPWIRDFTAGFLKTLDAGSWWDPAFAGEQIPTLEEAMALIKGTGIPFFVEVKDPHMSGVVKASVEAAGATPDDIIIWARAGECRSDEYRDNYPEPKRVVGLWFPELVDDALLQRRAEAGDWAIGILATRTDYTPSFVDWIHSYGLLVFSLSSNPPNSVDIPKMVSFGTDITTSFDAQGGIDFKASLACADGIDQDMDGLIDWPDDPDCLTQVDDSELPACVDEIDNNGDGNTDFPDDPLCDDADDRSEIEVCQDLADNDGDGLFDYPEDPGCEGPLDDSEVPEPAAWLLHATAVAALGWLRRSRRSDR